MKITKFIVTVIISLYAVTSAGAKTIIPITTSSSALVFSISSKGTLTLTYLGPKSKQANRIGKTSEDVVYPTNPKPGETSDLTNQFGIRATHANGDVYSELRYVKHSVKTVEPGVTQAEITLKDKHYPFFVTVFVRGYEKENVFEQWTEIRHSESSTVTLYDFASAGLTFHADSYWLTHFPGEWISEMQYTEAELTTGIKLVDSKRGIRNGHVASQDFLLSFDGKAQENSGRVLAASLAWSGSFAHTFEVDSTNRLRILTGINPHASEWHLEPGEVFETPKLIFTYSDQGKGKASRSFHRWARAHGLRGGHDVQLTMLNNWEATFFDFDEQIIIGLFDGAKQLGVELFLLDDGWFGNGKYARVNDTAGLGDWQPNAERFPNGLAPLVTQAAARGLKFGIWLEPEMVNPVSELYEAHPDWVITQPHRELSLFRNQLVLDLTRPEVREHVFNAIDQTLTNTPGTAYVKWDCNRPMNNAGSSYLSAAKQSHLRIAYIRALYDIMNRVATKYPNVEVMVCSGGGGRVDYGSLKYFQQFWPSDNTDALSRIAIQWGYSHFYPATAISAHVTRMGERPFKFAFDVAMSQRLGVDVDTKTLTPDEMAICQQAIALYKSQLRDIVQFGDIYRLESPYEGNRASLVYVSENKKKAAAFVWQMTADPTSATTALKLNGLDRNRNYRVVEVNLVPGTTSSIPANGQLVSGAKLIDEGISLPFGEQYDSAVLTLIAE